MEIRNQKRTAMFLAAIGTVMLLAGCGGNASESVHMDADTQEEETTESESVTEDTTDEEDENAAGSEVNENVDSQEQRDASEDQMEIDEETQKELTEELLEEEQMDTSVMEQERSTQGCTFDIPEGFEESEDVDNMYVTKRYPIDASTIYYTVMEGDISLQLLTEESFVEQMEEELLKTYDQEIEIVVDSFEHTEISGYPAFRILCHYKVGEVEITQLEYAINADKSYMVIYSQTSDYDYMDAYEASAATIQVN